MALGRNEKCHCGSGRKYKHCHEEIDRAPRYKKYGAAQAVYARHWRLTSQQHYNDGVYRWLAEQLTQFSPQRIVDIGCGSGHALVALREVLNPGLEIIGIDENRSCLQDAKATLRTMQGIDAQLIARMHVTPTGIGYTHIASPFTLDAQTSCVLVESDVCNDPSLWTELQRIGPFDAVTIWLTGTHMLRQHNVNVLQHGVRSDGDHRLYVQNSAYELADKILRPGGVLQVSDRGETPSNDELRQDLVEAHEDQASVTSLEVQPELLGYRPYALPRSGRTPMVGTSGRSGRVPNTLNWSIVSVISMKT